MDEHGNDIRNGIYLPDEDQVWIGFTLQVNNIVEEVLNNLIHQFGTHYL